MLKVRVDVVAVVAGLAWYSLSRVAPSFGSYGTHAVPSWYSHDGPSATFCFFFGGMGTVDGGEKKCSVFQSSLRFLQVSSSQWKNKGLWSWYRLRRKSHSKLKSRTSSEQKKQITMEADVRVSGRVSIPYPICGNAW